MPNSGRCGVLLLSLLAGPAFGQAGGLPTRLNLSRAWVDERRAPPEFRIWDGDTRGGVSPARNGLIAATSVGDGMQVGVGRYSVLELARPRTHLEAEPRPMDLRRRERGIAAVGFSFSF